MVDEKSNLVSVKQNELAVGETQTDHQSENGSMQFVTFTIGEEEYGVDIMSVREIKGWSETTMLPNTPDYMRGVLNLRGLIVPIFDLRSRFGGGNTEVTPLHVVIIIAVGDRFIGILVDAVSDIVTINDAEIRNVPKMERRVENEYLSGLVTVEGRLVALLDTEKLFSHKDVEQGQEAASLAKTS